MCPVNYINLLNDSWIAEADPAFSSFLLVRHVDRAGFALDVGVARGMGRAGALRGVDGISLTFSKFMGREDGAIVRAVAVA